MNVSALQGNLGALTSAVQGQELGAQVVTNTLEMLHQQGGLSQNSSDSSYDFQNSVLGAYAGVGTKINIVV